MEDNELLEVFHGATANLFDLNGFCFAPIRHHSPACAWALRAMIAEIKPTRILIEAPVDFEDHIPLLLHEETRPPVAIASLFGAVDQRVVGYYPFCCHSPEYIALHEGTRIGAELQFIDLPSDSKASRNEAGTDRTVVIASDHHFNANDYSRALAHKLGCRDSFELWDHLFESRIGGADWRAFFTDVAGYCAGLRAATHPDEIVANGDDERERCMAAHLARHKVHGPVVVVTGGFHTPALIDSMGKASESGPVPKRQAKSYVIRYGFEALDALNGYAAGLPQPAYYDEIWTAANNTNGPPDWKQVGLEITSGFASSLREQGRAVAVPAQVEILRVAETLAQLRGRPGVMRYDLFDGVRAALLKGETQGADLYSDLFQQFLTGTSIGDIPRSAGSPPLVEDVRDRARANHIDISDGAQKRRKLDIHRKPSQRAASRFFHAMTLLDTGFARREVGPDFVTRSRTDLLFEEWSYAWSPGVEGRLIELTILGDLLPTVCVNRLHKAREDLEKEGRNGDVLVLVQWLRRGLLAGLDLKLQPFLDQLSNDIRNSNDFNGVAQGLQELHAIACTTGPLRPPADLDFSTVLEAVYSRLVYLIEDLAETSEEHAEGRLKALRTVTEFLRGQDNDRFDADLYNEAIDRVVTGQPPAMILGAALGICVQAGSRSPKDLTQALAGQFEGATLTATDRIGILIGMLSTVPSLLWRAPEIIDCVDGFICGMEKADFIAILPHLRHAFTVLTPRETDKLADLLANRQGYDAGSLAIGSMSFSEDDLHAGLEMEQIVQAAIAADGLQDWLLAGETG